MAANPSFARRHQCLLLAGLLLLLVVLLAWWGNRDTTPSRPPQKVAMTPAQMERGRYLVRAGDCVACHQTERSAPFAGGFPIKTPFGTIYGTNITPHPDRGIGRWTADEFYRAVTRGRAPGGRNLYPAMPYVSYHRMSRDDADLIYGYLMAVAPSAQANQAPDVAFPLNLRMLLAGWNLLFFDTDPLPAASAGSSPAWERGRYLANVMGHCGECHTPRGKLGQMRRGEWFGGYAANRYLAPDLTPQGLAGRGWRPEDVVSFLQSGESARGSAYDEMATVVRHSSQYLSEGDLRAVSTYLLGDSPPAPAPMPASARQVPQDGQRHYRALCAGCHGSDGQGLPNTVPPLAGGSTIRNADARNLVQAMIDGLPPKRLNLHAATAGMPAFDTLPDAEIAAIANYCRTAWGGQPGDISAEQVAGLRRAQARSKHRGDTALSAHRSDREDPHR